MPARYTSIAIAVGALVLLAGCGGDSTGGAGAGGSAPGLTETAHDFAFSNPSLMVSPGASVTLSFHSDGPSTHSFTASDINVDLVAAAGQTQTATFTAPQSGSISFHCKFHPTMTGTITVTGSSAAAAPSPSSSSSGNGYGYGAGY